MNLFTELGKEAADGDPSAYPEAGAATGGLLGAAVNVPNPAATKAKHFRGLADQFMGQESILGLRAHRAGKPSWDPMDFGRILPDHKLQQEAFAAGRKGVQYMREFSKADKLRKILQPLLRGGAIGAGVVGGAGVGKTFEGMSDGVQNTITGALGGLGGYMGSKPIAKAVARKVNPSMWEHLIQAAGSVGRGQRGAALSGMSRAGLLAALPRLSRVGIAGAAGLGAIGLKKLMDR